ncbi:MAG: hypothetical protein RMJ55_14065 [Roseiflexaceae bacterium]|nr:hypothetical protein [Roseiflexaceae bacterium]
MVFEQLFRYLPNRPAPKVAGYGCEARLRGLDQAIPDYFLKLRKSRATESEARLRGLDRAIPDCFLKLHIYLFADACAYSLNHSFIRGAIR